jgi:hypothetical protein
MKATLISGVETMITRLFRYTVFLIAILVCTESMPALADAFSYATQQRVVNVGMLMTSAENIQNRAPGTQGTYYSENPDPNFFYVVDSRTDLKPVGMTLVNPLAPPIITPDIYQRWYARQSGDPAFQPGTSQYQAFQVGAKVTKNMGAYWEVNLDNMSEQDMRKFDLLYIHSHMHNVSFNAEQLQKLMKYVEGGGTLWIENCGGFSFNPGSPFLMDVQMMSGGGNGQGVIGEPTHPLMTTPYVLSPQEIQVLGDKSVGGYYLYQNPIGSNTDQPPGTVPGSQTLVPVVWNSRGQADPGNGNPGDQWRPYILAGQIGSGRLIFSVQDSGCAINDYVGGSNAGYGGNSGAISGENMSAAHIPDLKFVYNMLTWAATNHTANADDRRTGNSSEDIGPALVEKWTAPNPGTDKTTSASLYHHCVFNVDANLVLHCYDMQPGEDLDGDGNPDEGIPDYLLGTAYDEIWNLNLKAIDGNATSASTPSIVEFFDPNFGNNPPVNGHANFFTRELVVVVLNDGTVVAARAFPRDNIPPLYPMSATPQVDWVSPGNFGTDYQLPANLPVPSIAFSEGVIFLGVNTSSGARVVAIDPRNGESAFAPGPTGNIGAHDWQDSSVPIMPAAPTVCSSPTVGYILDTTTGASDKVVYLTVPTYSDSSGTKYAASVRAFWFGTKGEVMVQNGTSGADFVFHSSRFITNVPWYKFDPANPGNGNPLLRPRLFMVHRNSNGQIDNSEELGYFNYNPANPTSLPGADQFGVNGNQVIVGPTVKGIAATDPGITFYANYTLDWSQQVQNLGAQRRMMFAPDINSVGNTIGGTSALSPDDILYYTVNTTASGSTNPGRGVLFAVNEQATRPILKWTYVMQDGFSIQVNNQTVNIPPRLMQTDPTLPGSGTPITNVQFTGSPAWHDGITYAVATATLANMQVSVLCAFNSNPNIILRLNQSIDPSAAVRIWQFNPVLMSNSTTPARVDLQPSQYTVSYDTGVINITSMAIPGTVNNFVTASLPFVVQVGTGPETLVNPAPGDVDNLLWYMVIPSTLMIPPNAIGPKISNPLLGQVSSSPIIQGNTLWLGFSGGQMAAFDANPAAGDPSVQAPGSQAPLFTTTTVLGHMTSVTDLSFNAPGDAGPIIGAPVGTAGVMVANTEGGIRTYENAVTVIADKGRLIEVNSIGDAVWTSHSSRSNLVAGGPLPQYWGFDASGNGNGQPVNAAIASGVNTQQMVPYSAPSVIRQAPNNNFVVVDTGNNRVLQVDYGSNVSWEINNFIDPNNILPKGSSLNLNEPTDCTFWTVAGPNPQQYTMHCLITDSGNYRVIELVSVFNATQVNPPTPWQIVWVSKSTLEGRKYKYRTAERIWQLDPNNPTVPPVPYTLATISNYRLVGSPGIEANPVPGAQADSSGSSVVTMDGNGVIVSTLTNIILPNGTVQQVVNPTCFTKFDALAIDPNTGRKVIQFHYLLCDANGCYQLTSDPTNPTRMVVEWMLSAQDYYWMTGKRLVATSIQRLSVPVLGTPLLHQFLITNHYDGMDDPTVFGAPPTTISEFHGEAFVLNPVTYNPAAAHDGYTQDYLLFQGTLIPNPAASIIWRSPSESFINGAMHRSIGSQLRGTAAQTLEAPTCAVRL